MSQANEPITLKIHHGDDIRRFHLSQLKWSELTELLSSNYPTPYTLKYRDTDNDMVTMVTQQDLQDASDMSQDVIHLYVMDKDVIPAAAAAPATASAPDIDMKSSEDDLASQLSHEEISTLLSECLSDPAVITAIPPFLTTFIDQLTSNMSTPTPLSTSWTQSLQQHPTIRDHVILSVVLPRLQQKLNQADQNNVAARIPSHVFPMVKGFIPMLPMFLPSIIPMITKFMSESSTSTDTQAQTNPFANSPFMSMLGPMLSGMQQPAQTAVPSATSPASATSPTTNSAAQVNPFGLLAPLLAGAAANSSATSPTNSNSATQAQAQANPLLGLLGPLLAANAANSGNQPNPFASMFQQYPQPPGGTNTNTATNTDYTEQLATLESMGLGSHDLNLSLLQQWNGDVERVMEFLSTMA